MHRPAGHLPAAQLTVGLRPAGPADADLLEALDVEVAAAGLPGFDAHDPLVALQVRARRADRAARWPGARKEVVERDGVAVGALLVAVEDDGTLRVVDLHLLRAARGRGTGTAVLRELGARADAARTSLRLTTRPDNAPMRAAAAAAGFVEVAADALDVSCERPPSAAPSA